MSAAEDLDARRLLEELLAELRDQQAEVLAELRDQRAELLALRAQLAGVAERDPKPENVPRPRRRRRAKATDVDLSARVRRALLRAGALDR